MSEGIAAIVLQRAEQRIGVRDVAAGGETARVVAVEIVPLRDHSGKLAAGTVTIHRLVVGDDRIFRISVGFIVKDTATIAVRGVGVHRQIGEKHTCPIVKTPAIVAGGVAADRVVGQVQCAAAVTDAAAGVGLIMVDRAAVYAHRAIVKDAATGRGGGVGADMCVIDVGNGAYALVKDTCAACRCIADHRGLPQGKVNQCKP